MPVLVSAGAGTDCGVLWTSGGGDLGTSLCTGPGLAPRNSWEDLGPHAGFNL